MLILLNLINAQVPEAQFIANDTFERNIHTEGVEIIILYFRLSRLLQE